MNHHPAWTSITSLQRNQDNSQQGIWTHANKFTRAWWCICRQD